MTIKYLSLVLIIFLMMGITNAALDFKWTPDDVTLDGDYDSDDENSASFTNGDLTMHYGYRDKMLYIHFSISDSSFDDEDRIGIYFDMDESNDLSDGDEYVFLFRDDSLDSSSKWDCVIDAPNPSRSWEGECLIPFEDVGITLEPSPSEEYGPTVHIEALDDKEQEIIGSYRTDETAGEFKSSYYWAQPESLGLDFAELNVEDWCAETDGAGYPYYRVGRMMLYSNSEEPVTLESITIEAEGTGPDDEFIDHVELHYGSCTISTGECDMDSWGSFDDEPYPEDNGQVMLEVDHEATNLIDDWTTYWDVKYVFNDSAGSYDTGDSIIAPSFKYKLISFNVVGDYTGEELEVNFLEDTSEEFTTYDCETDAGCEEGQVCAYGSCRDMPEDFCQDDSDCDDGLCNDNFCVECVDNDDCEETEECVDNECSIVLCETGYVDDHECIEYECVQDSDCAEDETCSDHECVEPECIQNSDCGYNQKCVNTVCKPITCICGYVEDYECIEYDCCSDDDCENGQCVLHECVEVEQGDGSEDVNETINQTEELNQTINQTNEQNQTTQDLNQSVEDNETNEICLIEGETGIESCCEGLESVSCVEYVNGECLYADCGHTCTYCGNGECGPGENVCNCPDDCDAGDKPTETVMDYLVYGFGLLVLILVIYVIYNHFSKPKTMKPNKTVGKNQTSKKKK